MRTNRAAPRLFMASRTFSITSCRRGWRPSPGFDSIDAERSRTKTTVSIVPPPQPMSPEMIGLAAAKTNAAMASARQVRMRMWRSFFLPRDSRVALSRNCIAAHWMVLWRRRLRRWIATGTAAASSPHKSSGLRKSMSGEIYCGSVG